jgi:hypothetical protein
MCPGSLFFPLKKITMTAWQNLPVVRLDNSGFYPENQFANITKRGEKERKNDNPTNK